MCKRCSLLVVDDNESTAESIALFFRMGGHTVWTATNGYDALMLVQNNRPEVIVLDMSMRGMSGFEVARQIREGQGHQPRIITMSGYPIADIERRTDLKIDRHFRKPCDLEELVKVIVGGPC